jgi:hypothetical protein
MPKRDVCARMSRSDRRIRTLSSKRPSMRSDTVSKSSFSPPSIYRQESFFPVWHHLSSDVKRRAGTGHSHTMSYSALGTRAAAMGLVPIAGTTTQAYRLPYKCQVCCVQAQLTRCDDRFRKATWTTALTACLRFTLSKINIVSKPRVHVRSSLPTRISNLISFAR